MPLVVDLHGFVTGAVIHSRLTDLDTLAEQEGFVTLTPDGLGPPSGLDDGNDLPVWNVGGDVTLPDDAQFVLDSVDDVPALAAFRLQREKAKQLVATLPSQLEYLTHVRAKTGAETVV